MNLGQHPWRVPWEPLLVRAFGTHTSTEQEYDKRMGSPECCKKAVLLLLPGGRQRSNSLHSALTTPFFSSLKFMFSGLPVLQNVSTWKSSLQVAGLWWLDCFLATENGGRVVVQCSALRMYSGILSAEISRGGNGVSQHWGILPTFIQLVISSLLLFLSSALPFLLGRHFLKNVDRHLVLNPWLCMTSGRLLLWVCPGLQGKMRITILFTSYGYWEDKVG